MQVKAVKEALKKLKQTKPGGFEMNYELRIEELEARIAPSRFGAE